jgi:cytochrome P450
MTNASLQSTLEWQPESVENLANPFPIYARMRDEDPCHWSPRLKSWILTRYDDVKAVCLDRGQLSSDRLRPFFASMPGPEVEKISNIIRYLSLWMVFKDPPDHTRLRKLASKVFHAKSMQGMRPQIEEITQWLLEQLGEREEFDAVSDFAGPLPCLVIMAMLGVDQADLDNVKRMSDDMALFIGSSRVSAEKYDTAEAATKEMAQFFRDLIAQRKIEPRKDLLTELVFLRDGEDKLTDDETISMCILLLFAGHETTTNHIANGLLSLMQFPDQMEKLRANPSLANAAVEELLRFDGPSGAQVRLVKEPYTVHGKQLEPGQRIFIMLNAANRDPRAYSDPDRLDIERDGVAHLAFGFGLHICLGFPLARTEGQVAFPALLARYALIEPATDVRPWINSLVFRGMKELPVRVKLRLFKP